MSVSRKEFFQAAIIAQAKEDDMPAQRAECIWCSWLHFGLDTQIPNLGAEQCAEHKKLNKEYSAAIHSSPIESSWQERQGRFIEQAKEVYKHKTELAIAS